jgi:hypothetical protein
MCGGIPQVKKACDALCAAIWSWAGAVLLERPQASEQKRMRQAVHKAMRSLAASVMRASSQPNRSLMSLAAGGSSMAGHPSGNLHCLSFISLF